MSADAKGRPPFRVVLTKSRETRFTDSTGSEGVFGLGIVTVTQWRWSAFARNGRLVGASTEGYFNRSDAEANLLLLTPGYTRTEDGLFNGLLRETDPARFIPVEVEQ